MCAPLAEDGHRLASGGGGGDGGPNVIIKIGPTANDAYHHSRPDRPDEPPTPPPFNLHLVRPFFFKPSRRFIPPPHPPPTLEGAEVGGAGGPAALTQTRTHTHTHTQHARPRSRSPRRRARRRGRAWEGTSGPSCSAPNHRSRPPPPHTHTNTHTHTRARSPPLSPSVSSLRVCRVSVQTNGTVLRALPPSPSPPPARRPTPRPDLGAEPLAKGRRPARRWGSRRLGRGEKQGAGGPFLGRVGTAADTRLERSRKGRSGEARGPSGKDVSVRPPPLPEEQEAS